MNVTRWITNSEAEKFETKGKPVSDQEFAEAKLLVIESIKREGKKFGGYCHQSDDYCGVPVIDERFCYMCSLRAWGEIMALAWGGDYTDYAWECEFGNEEQGKARKMPASGRNEFYASYKLPDGRVLSCDRFSKEGEDMFNHGMLKLDAIYRDVCATDAIPSLSFKEDWTVKIIPPFGGAVCRFIVEKGSARVSVYLDFFNQLGFSQTAYWEAYPIHGDTFRCDVRDSSALIKAIDESLSEQKK